MGEEYEQERTVYNIVYEKGITQMVIISPYIQAISERARKNADTKNLYGFDSYELVTFPSLNNARRIKPADVTGDGVKDAIIFDIRTGTAWYSDGAIELSFPQYHRIDHEYPRKKLDKHLEELLKDKYVGK